MEGRAELSRSIELESAARQRLGEDLRMRMQQQQSAVDNVTMQLASLLRNADNAKAAENATSELSHSIEVESAERQRLGEDLALSSQPSLFFSLWDL